MIRLPVLWILLLLAACAQVRPRPIDCQAACVHSFASEPAWIAECQRSCQ